MQLLKGENDFYTNVERALFEIDPNWNSYEGLIICGTHTPERVEEKIEAIRQARERNMPFLGICFGHQLAVIEYARNVLGIKDATSEEFGKGTFVIKKREKLRVGLHNGESYWNNYEVAIKWKSPANFFTSQSHPEYQSSKRKPHPLLKGFLERCKNVVDGQPH